MGNHGHANMRVISPDAWGHNRRLLTGSIVAGDWVNIADYNQMHLYIAYTMGDAETSNTLNLQLEFSHTQAEPSTDEDFRETVTSTSGGTTTVTMNEYQFAATESAGDFDLIRLVISVADKWCRIGASETGIAANGGTLIITGTLMTD